VGLVGRRGDGARERHDEVGGSAGRKKRTIGEGVRSCTAELEVA
jgi:hypothetical protein